MSDRDRDDDGRALVPVGGARRGPLAWLASAFGLGRKAPLRLLAVPRDPIAGDKAVGAKLADGFFEAGGRAHDPLSLGESEDPVARAAWERLHGFGWLRDLAAAATPEKGREAAEALTRIWLDQMPERPESSAWRADLWGRRLLFWPAYAPYVMATRDLDYRARLMRMMVAGARHVEKNGDKCAPGLARITAWSGALAAALLVQGATGRIGRCEGGLERALRGGLSEDGGLLSRVPSQQIELVETLSLLRACYAASHHGLPDWLDGAQEGALACLLSVVTADGLLSSWQGAGPGARARIAAAIAGAIKAEAPAPRAKDWGYQRLSAKDALLIVDAAPPPNAKHHGAAAASTLAFEYCDGSQRLIVNCGGGAHLPDELRHLLRSTAAHSTLVLGDTNSTAILADGGLGRGVEEVTMERGTRDGQPIVETSHDGYVRRFGLAHQRELVLAADGSALNGTDALAPRGKAGKADIPFVIRFHLAPGIEVIRTADGRGALLRMKGRKAWQFKVRGALVEAEDSLWIDGDGQPRATQQLAVSGESPPEGMSISWELKRAG